MITKKVEEEENVAAEKAKKKKKVSNSVLLGAAFLMATSAIGPGFLTQTTVTQQSKGSWLYC